MSGFCFEHQQEEPCPVCANDRQRPPTTARLHQPPIPITDRAMWIVIRASILALANAVEVFGDNGPLARLFRQELRAIAAVIARRWGIRQTKLN